VLFKSPDHRFFHCFCAVIAGFLCITGKRRYEDEKEKGKSTHVRAVQVDKVSMFYLYLSAYDCKE
jgi:hypothetical protein